MTTIKVIDFETNGLGPEADPLEMGWHDVETDVDGNYFVGRGDARFLYSQQPIDPEAQAVHHITEDMAREGDPLYPTVWRAAHNHGRQRVDVYASHNIAMEQKYANAELTSGLPWICTMKCAMRAWPECPSFKNQVIRYWLQLVIPPEQLDLANASHQAQSDAYVTAHILLALLKVHSLEQLIQWTQEPKLYPRLTFGKHKGLAWRDVPGDYLDWMIRKAGAGEMEDWDDWVRGARQELGRRAK